MQIDSIIIASVVALLVVLACLAVVDARMLPAAPWRRSLLLSFGCAALGILAWLVLGRILAPHLEIQLSLPVAALAGVAAYLVTIAVRAGGGGVVASLAFSLLWSALVFAPTAVLTFVPSAWQWGIAPVDHGGSLAVNVAAGASAMGVLLVGGPRLRTATIGRVTGLIGMVGLGLGWLAWLAGVELAVDDVTPSILLNGMLSAAGGVVGWLVVQRVRHQSTTLNAVAAGLVSGLVAITAGAPLVTPASAVGAGLVAGAGACLFTLVRVGRSQRQQWFVVGSHLVAGAIGLVSLGVLATASGFAFTGSPTLLGTQILAVAVVAAYSATVSVLLWLALRRLARREAALAETA